MNKLLNTDYIKSLPITTNRIKLEIDKEKFFAKYSIVSYYSFDKILKKNLAYEQLSDCPFLSVCGIRSKWPDSPYQFTKFFILVHKSEQEQILHSLREYNAVRMRVDNLSNYTSSQQQRIFASLAINALGEKRTGKRLYNNGFLLICDDKNFLVSEKKKELVCLKIEVNEYLNLTAKTTSFSNPYNEKVLFEYSDCVFQVSKDINGFLWSGYSVKPVVVKKLNKSEIKLDELFINKKRFSDNKNLVPYWPYSQENYTHSKLFALSQIIESVNDKFRDELRLDFSDFQVEIYDEYKTDKDTLNFLTDHLSGRNIYIDNPFGSIADNIVKKMEGELKIIMNNNLSFSSKPTEGDMLIKLCEPLKEQSDDTYYSKLSDRECYDNNTVVQHKIFYNDPKEDTFEKSEARRILIELFVKDCIIKRQIPTSLCQLIGGWTFMEYKINDGNVIGASLISDNDGHLHINDFGFSQSEMPTDFVSFANQELLFNDYQKIKGARDYKVLKKNGNIYLIIDTDEIPILDAQKIDDAYEGIMNGNECVWMFKRKRNNIVYDYLRGYIGFHLWKSDGINGEENGAYSYISGFNCENLKIMPNTKMDRMPRARKLFILHSERSENIESDKDQIANMLKFGFGRWNEMMTYPFPFKFLQEYLDNKTEIIFGKHWKDITYTN